MSLLFSTNCETICVKGKYYKGTEKTVGLAELIKKPWGEEVARTHGFATREDAHTLQKHGRAMRDEFVKHRSTRAAFTRLRSSA